MRGLGDDLAPLGMNTAGAWGQPDRLICRPFGWGGVCTFSKGDGGSGGRVQGWAHMSAPITLQAADRGREVQAQVNDIELRFRTADRTRARIDRIDVWIGARKVGAYSVPGRPVTADRAEPADRPQRVGEATSPQRASVRARRPSTNQASYHSLGGDRYVAAIRYPAPETLDGPLNVSILMSYADGAHDQEITVEHMRVGVGYEPLR